MFTRLLVRFLLSFRNPFKLAGLFLFVGVTLLVIDYNRTNGRSVSYYSHVASAFDIPAGRSSRMPVARPRDEEAVGARLKSFRCKRLLIWMLVRRNLS